MDKTTNNSRDKNDTKKSSGRRNHFIGRNMTKWNEGTKSNQGIRERGWSILGRRWSSLCRWKNLYAE